jgi:hypothetical protein
MSNAVSKYRLPLALATGFLILALLGSAIAVAFARGVTARGATQFPVFHSDVLQTYSYITDPHHSSNWGGNEATGALHAYRRAQVDFRIPRLSDPPSTKGDTVLLWAGLGGDFRHGGTQLVQGGIVSQINDSGKQANFAFYEYMGTLSITAQSIPFSKGLNAGDVIDVIVESDYLSSGTTTISIKDEKTGEVEGPSANAEADIPISDGATGECIAERTLPYSLAEYNPNVTPTPPTLDTVFLNDCVVSNNQGTMHPVGPNNGWPNDWYHIVGRTGDLVEGLGAVDSHGSTPMYWKARY